MAVVWSCRRVGGGFDGTRCKFAFALSATSLVFIPARFWRVESLVVVLSRKSLLARLARTFAFIDIDTICVYVNSVRWSVYITPSTTYVDMHTDKPAIERLRTAFESVFAVSSMLYVCSIWYVRHVV